MKKLFFLLLLASSFSFGQIKINPVTTGIPPREATDLMVRVLPFETTATTCGLYYEIKDCDENRLTEGNIWLTEAEFTAWGQSNTYIENLVLSKLNLQRKVD